MEKQCNVIAGVRARPPLQLVFVYSLLFHSTVHLFNFHCRHESTRSDLNLAKYTFGEFTILKLPVHIMRGNFCSSRSRVHCDFEKQSCL